MLDNDFQNPDLDRFLDAYKHFDPSVAVIGDAYKHAEACRFQSTVDELHRQYPYRTHIVVPKHSEAFETLDTSKTTLGYPNGYSDLEPGDYSELSDWRGEPVHILGSSPTQTWSKIQELTQPTLTGDPPADIVGLDYNGFHKAAYIGEYWSREGYQNADQLSIRETMNQSLQEAKKYWQERGVWPGTTPNDIAGPASQVPMDDVHHINGGNPVSSKEELEETHILEDGSDVYGFETEKARDFFQFREGLTDLD